MDVVSIVNLILFLIFKISQRDSMAVGYALDSILVSLDAVGT